MILSLYPSFKHSLHLVLITASILCGFTTELQAQDDAKLSVHRFRTPETTSKPLTWWHWINGNVTRDGIKKDLTDMKWVGIGGVQLFDTHMYLPKGPVRYGSEAWYNHVSYAMQVCDSLGLEFYITNSPGWSGAGGPWVDLERSMKQLVYSETDIASGSGYTYLTQPYSKRGFYKEVAVLAVPAGDDGESSIKAKIESITDSENSASLNRLIDNNYQSSVDYAGKIKTELLFTFKSAVNLNALNISLEFSNAKNNFSGSIEASEDGSNYKELARFDYKDHYSTKGNFSIPFLSEGIKFLRLNIEGVKRTGNAFNISEIKLRDLNSIDNWAARTGMSKSQLLSENLFLKDKKKAIDSDSVIDITKYFNSSTGKINWTAPKGKWTILRFGYTTTAKTIHPAVDEGYGYEVDKLDPEAVSYQFSQALGRIIKDAGALSGKTFKGILFDSFEGGFQNWTGDLPQMFREKRGYDFKSYLPVMTGRTIESGLKTSAVMWDFQQTITSLIAENYYGTMQKLAHKHNLQIFSESQGGPMAPAYANAYTDVPMNEFWTDGIQKREKLIKQTTSIANVLGRKVVAAEAFTSKPEFAKWQNLPQNLKPIGDYAFTTGINRFIFHTYTHQPYDVVPGFTMGRYGTHFGRTNTWWKYAGEWINYLGRSQYLLQQGRTVADVCYLFPKDVVYEFPPKMALIPHGYSYDVCYPDYLKDMKVDGAEFYLPSGAKYRLMILPEYAFMDLETLQGLQKLLKDGLILSGNPPVGPSDLKGFAKREEFDLLVKEIWGNLDGKSETVRNYGKGKVYLGKDVQDILNELNVEPDVIFQAGQADSLRYIHRTGKNFDTYFISNQQNRSDSINISVRTKGCYPEIWDAVSGKVWDVPVFDTVGSRTNIPVVLEPNGSLFIVFNKNLSTKWVNNLTVKSNDKKQSLMPNAISLSDEKILSREALSVSWGYNDGSQHNKMVKKVRPEQIVAGPWKLEFLDGRGAPKSISQNGLALWQHNSDPGIKYYSGTAAYNTTFQLVSQPAADEVVFLDLGEMYDIAEVLVNGKNAGIIWKKPHRLDITYLLKKGKNDLRIRVTNRWINRLIGDENISTNLKYDMNGSIFTRGRLTELPSWLNNLSLKKPDNRTTFTTWRHYSSDSPLVNSGLAGPVRLVFYKQLNFNNNN